MKFANVKKIVVVLASIALTTSLYAYNQNSAKNACINKVTEFGTGQYHNVKNVHVTDQGHHSYAVTGNVASYSDGKRHSFSCKIRHKELVSYHVNYGNNKKNDSAAAIAAGVIALAVIAAANKHKDKHKDHNSGGNAFNDMHYLKKQCRQEVRHQIQADHPRRHISKVKFDSAHLNNRKLQGTGYVIFKNGNERDLNYKCDFDRRGHIYDGYYHYRRR